MAALEWRAAIPLMAGSYDEPLRIVQRIERRSSALTTIALAVEDNMTAQLDTLTREVQESRSVTESAVALITGLADEIRAPKTIRQRWKP